MKIVSENRFSGKPLFYTIASRAEERSDEVRLIGKNAKQIVLFARYLVKFVGSFEKLFNA